MSIEVLTKNLDLGTSLISSLLLENHNGIVEYDTTSKYRYKIVRREIVDNNMESKKEIKAAYDIVLLTMPKVNACTTILVKCKNKFFTLHHRPDEITPNVYNDFFNYLKSQEIVSLDVLYITNCSHYFSQKAREENIQINIIPFNFNIGQFELENFVMSGEPNSIYMIYSPDMDSLLIYGDKLIETNSPAVFFFDNVFDTNIEYSIVYKITQLTIRNFFENYNMFSTCLLFIFLGNILIKHPTFKNSSYPFGKDAIRNYKIVLDSESKNSDEAKIRKKYIKYKLKYLNLKTD